MKHYTNNNLIQFLMVGESDENYRSVNELVEIEALPLSIELEGNPNKAFSRLSQFLLQSSPPVVILNADLPREVYTEFIRKVEQFILPKNPNFLLFISSIQKLPEISLKQKFPAISGFINTPFQRQGIEMIAAMLLLQMQF